jgi:hypothetical protein
MLVDATSPLLPFSPPSRQCRSHSFSPLEIPKYHVQDFRLLLLHPSNLENSSVLKLALCYQACSVCAHPKPQAGKLASKLLQAQARSSLDLHLPTPSPVPPQCPVLVAIRILGTLEEQRGLYNGGFGPHVRVVVCLMLCSHPVLAASSHMSPLHPLFFHRILPYTCGALYLFPPSSPSCPYPPLHILTTIACAKTPAVPSHRHYSRTTSDACASLCGRSSTDPRRHAHA